jgi:predicted nuclease with TOPRIM domain
MKALLIVFVCLTVASLGGTIVLYTFQEDIKNSAADAQRQASAARSLASDAQRQYDQLVQRVLGINANAADAANILEQIDRQLQDIFSDERMSNVTYEQGTAVLTTMRDLYESFAERLDEFQELQSEYEALEKQLAELTDSVQATQGEFEEMTEQLTERVRELESQNEEHRQTWDADVTRLTGQLDEASAAASVELNAEREKTRELQEKLEDSSDRIRDLLAQLASFKPSADRYAILRQPDGRVTKTVPGENIVYIGLGRQDGVRPGMTFTVYSRIKGIPESGAGKATLEVINAFATVSECRVTSDTIGDPVIKDDPVANPVFDRARQYSFVVAGDFDLDFDGRIDDPNGEQIARLIESYGGKVMDEITTKTDFVVLGDAPPEAMPPSEEPAGDVVAEEARRERESLEQAARDRFDRVLGEAQALGIPVLTRTQFLHFLGQVVPADIEEDQRPSL